MAEPAADPVDIVYTWVDDSFPGYLEQLNQYVADKRDTNPNRTRDNLDLIKYSLRSLAAHRDLYRRIYIISCRPQVPSWLNAGHPDIRVVHHDEIMPAAILPTFNSFAIVSHMHLLPGLGRRFIYFEDDMLAGTRFGLGPLTAPDGRALVLTNPAYSKTRDQLDRAKSSPWDLAIATADEALGRVFGPRPRKHIGHAPRLMDRDIFAGMLDRFASEIETTRRSRFRADGNVPPEYVYQHYLLETGQGVAASDAQSRQAQGYASLENFLPWTWLQLKWLDWRDPYTLTLNDSFERAPNPSVVGCVRRWLERRFPEPSPYEKAG